MQEKNEDCLLLGATGHPNAVHPPYHHHHLSPQPSTHPPTYYPQSHYPPSHETGYPHHLSTVCPKHGNASIKNDGHRKMLSVEKPVEPPPASKEKDTKEIMKKRRERAICIVSILLDDLRL